MYKIFSVFLCFLTLSSFTFLPKEEGYKYTFDQSAIYKIVDSVDLRLEISFPKKRKYKKNPAIIFFYGDGWKYGSISQFAPHAEYYVQKDFVIILVNYRVEERNQTIPLDVVEDAKSAMRYIKQNSKKLRIDTSKIIACGGTSDSHLAAAKTLVKGYNFESGHLNFSPKPSTLILFNPVIDNDPHGYNYERIVNQFRKFSPIHNTAKGVPTTIILIGTKDQLIPIETVNKYKYKMNSVGSICQLKLYKDQKL